MRHRESGHELATGQAAQPKSEGEVWLEDALWTVRPLLATVPSPVRPAEELRQEKDAKLLGGPPTPTLTSAVLVLTVPNPCLLGPWASGLSWLAVGSCRPEPVGVSCSVSASSWESHGVGLGWGWSGRSLPGDLSLLGWAPAQVWAARETQTLPAAFQEGLESRGNHAISGWSPAKQ